MQLNKFNQSLKLILSLLFLSFGCCQLVYAQDDASLAKAIQNPLTSMVTLPFQANYNRGFGAYDRTQFNLNIQPVIPIKGEKWNVISRTIIPINSVPVGPTSSEFGLGDTNMSLFWTPAETGSVVWGIGPSFSLPTASNPEVLGSEKWSAGATGVLFYSTGNWTMGGVVSNLWSVAGDDNRDDVNFLTLQYFLNYNLGNGWAIGTVPIVTANWEADSDNTWTIPWGIQVSKVTRFGNQAVNLLAGYYKNSEHPDNGPDSQFRIQLNLLFP